MAFRVQLVQTKLQLKQRGLAADFIAAVEQLEGRIQALDAKLQQLQEKEADGWLGFSPSVSRALEEAYQTWLQEDAGGALLPQNFRYLAQFIQDDCPAQRICRVSNNLPPEKCAVHLELKALEEKVQHLEAQLSAAGELEQKLKRALDDARSQAPLPLSEAERLVVTLRKALWPGRLVKWRIPDAGEACLVGRILCMSGSEAGVAFADLDDAVWLPCCALEADSQAEVLSRSGSKVFWHGGGRPQKALVQGDGLHPATVRIWSEGVECSVAIQDLTARTPTAHPDLGDVVRQGQSLGLVVQSDDLGICIQSFAGSQEKQPQAFIPTTDVDEALAAGDLELLTLQPGCSVMRGQEVGVLHCRRGEYAIVDFLGEIGWEGPLDHLEPAKEVRHLHGFPLTAVAVVVAVYFLVVLWLVPTFLAKFGRSKPGLQEYYQRNISTGRKRDIRQKPQLV
ncbi:Uncharacterized protein SCF082_LOCUS23297 [Durusdinium trenchii]|uniref:Uncharacterized protein n=1 Tax=Durusdinium trenchii TaxID=1381693 RepID=A0ABP0LMC1_9DINO